MLTQQLVEPNYWPMQSMLAKWLHNRQELIIKFCQLSEYTKEINTLATLPSEEELEIFCDLMMDYVSAGHFEFYEKVAQTYIKTEIIHPVGNINLLFPQINKTTEIVLAFHDYFTEREHFIDYQQLTGHLNKLGEAMELRFELEDQLLNPIYYEYQDHTQQNRTIN